MAITFFETRPKPRRFKTHLSKLHRRIKKELGLKKLGFKSERQVGKYRVDEINTEKRIIVEINGDAVHGNPRQYGPRDLLPYGLTADEKWTSDCRRQSYLERKGYRVIVVWESDDIQKKLDVLMMALGCYNWQ